MDGGEGTSKYIDTNRLWYNVKLPLKQCSLKELATFNIEKQQLDDLYQEAQQLLDDESSTFHGGYDRKQWYAQQFQQRGTVADRIANAAVNLSGPEFMFHLDSFAFLFDTARNDSHNFEAALKALGAVWPKLLPARPLKKFAAQYFATLPEAEGEDGEVSPTRAKVLLYWYIEDTLKRTYGQFLSIAEHSLKDNLTARREAWLDVIGKLLSSIAEVRHITIGMVVEKMGDPLSKISHKAYHLLLGMLSETSTTQSVLLGEIEKVIFQKNCPIPVQKYCINVINQLVFNRDERKLALKCVQTFLALFKQLAVSGTIDQNITDALIVGLRRAFPFTGSDFSVLDPHIDALFVIANTGSNFLQRVSATMLLYQLVTKGYSKLESRFYRVVYHLLLVGPKQLPHSSQLTGFFALLYKTVRNDKNSNRVASFVHRLLQRCMFANEAFVCASLLLVAEAVNCHNSVRKLIRGQQQEVRKTALAAAQKKPVAGQQQPSEEYDAKNRDPQYANAASQCVWVLNALANHTHPSVVKLAVLIREGCDVSFDTHPLDDLTITNFLEMFVDAHQEESKEAFDAHGNKLVSNDTKGVSVFRRAVHVAHIPRISDPNFATMDPAHVDVNALFLHRFAFQRQKFLKGRMRRPGSYWEKGEADADEEAEIEKRIANLNNAFHGPDGKKSKKQDKKSSASKKKGEEGDEAPMEDSDDDFDPDAFDHDFNEDAGDDDDSFDWGDGSDGYGDSEEDEDAEEFSRAASRVERLTGKKRRKFDENGNAEDDDDEDDTGALSSRKPGTDEIVDAGEFHAMMNEHKAAPSKKQRKEDAWVNERSSGSSGRGGGFSGRGNGARGGRGGSSFRGRGRR